MGIPNKYHQDRIHEAWNMIRHHSSLRLKTSHSLIGRDFDEIWLLSDTFFGVCDRNDWKSVCEQIPSLIIPDLNQVDMKP